MNNEVKLVATIVSDTHIDIKHPQPKFPVLRLKKALKMSKKNKSDLFITVGDNTSRGAAVNWNMTRECFKKAKGCAPNIVLTVGNHDCWHDESYEAGIEEYYSACRDIMGRSIDRPYFSTVINGYSFISLGNESDAGCEANISDEQVAWLSTELEKATENGRPAFVFCHQSLNGRHGLPRTWDKDEDPNPDPNDGGVGEKSEEIAAILKSHKNVFYFSGHSHMGLAGEKKKKTEGYSSFECEDGLHLVNLPSLSCGNHHGEKNSMGITMKLEIYSDRVRITPQNSALGKNMKSVKIQNNKPYYEVKL